MGLLDKITSLFSARSESEIREPAPRTVDDVRSGLAGFKRACWRPITEEGDDASINTSKFGGIPYLRSDEEWPVCANCSKPMQLFLQLNPKTLPASKQMLWGSGLLQFFYCTTSEPLCEVEAQAWAPFSKSTLLRVASIEGEGLRIDAEPVEDAFSSRRIIGWEESDDYPSEIELERSGYAFESDLSDEYLDLYPRSGDKLLGWPLWVQDVEYPNCPICDKQMQLVFQIDSNDNLPFMFGDAGVAHISNCPDHLQELGFGWACS